MTYLREPLEVTFSDKGPPTEPGSTIIAGSSEGKSSLSINPRANTRALGFHLCCGRIGKFTCCVPCQPIVKTIFPAHEWFFCALLNSSPDEVTCPRSAWSRS